MPAMNIHREKHQYKNKLPAVRGGPVVHLDYVAANGSRNVGPEGRKVSNIYEQIWEAFVPHSEKKLQYKRGWILQDNNFKTASPLL